MTEETLIPKPVTSLQWLMLAPLGSLGKAVWNWNALIRTEIEFWLCHFLVTIAG